MSIFVNVVNQKMSITSTFDNIVSGSQGFVKFRFNLSDDWDGLMPFAQFAQNGLAYNQYLDSDNCVTLPSEIGAGTCTMMLYGSAGTKRATTNYLTLKIDKDILVADAQSTEISQSLYAQLVAMVESVTSFSGQGVVDLQNAVADLQSQVNARATLAQLTSVRVEALAASNANALALEGKADAADVADLADRVDALQNNEAIADAIEQAVSEEMARYLLSGELANLTIEDHSLTRDKVDNDFESTLEKADTAMQPSVYDRQNLRADVYAYAKAQADTVQRNLDGLETEVVEARDPSDSVHCTSLKDSIRGAIQIANDYAQALLAEYEAFTIKIVSTLPAVGEDRTFYLIPKESGNGYDKYWYITNDVGDKQWDVFGASSTLVVSELPVAGDPDVDYILNSANGCLYYKWISNAWKVVAGSLAYVSSTLPAVANGNEYTDYYIVSPDNGSYIHYRLINGAYRVIGGDAYTKAEIDAMVSALQADIDANEQSIGANATNITSLGRSLDSLQQELRNLDTEGYTYYATYGTTTLLNGQEADNVFTLYEVKGEEEAVKSQFVITGGGGGGGQQSSTTLTVERITQSPIVATTTDKVVVSIMFSSVDGDGEDVDGTYTWKLGNTVLSTGSLVQGQNTFDLTDYCNIGTQKLTLIVSDEGGSSVVKTWSIQVVDVRIDSAFSDRITYPVGNAVNFTYTPYGSVPKVVHFILDGVELQSVSTSSSGTLQSYSIPAQSHGAHLLECFITATINNKSVETEHIYKDIVWYDATSEVPVVSCIYRNDHYHIVLNPNKADLNDYYVLNSGTYSKAPYAVVDSPDVADIDKYYELSGSTYTLTSDNAIQSGKTYYVKELTQGVTYYSTKIYAKQYDTTSIPYCVFHPLTNTPTVTQSADSNTTTKSLTTASDVWAYKTDVVGDHSLVISCGETSVTITMGIEELDIDVAPVTANLAFDFNPAGLSNTNVNRLWSDANNNGVTMTVSQNFDWSNGGYQIDAEGNQYFCVKAGTTANFSYNLFETNPALLGMEFKLVFKTTNVKNVGASFLNCVDAAQNSDVGLQMRVHEAYLRSSSGSLYIPYSEEDKIEFEFNVNPLDTENEEATSVIMSYEDGVGMRPMIYDAAHRLYHYTPSPIVVGSPDCDVHIYRMKAYTSALTDSNILANFIADAGSADEMIARYNRNQIYDENNNLTPEALANACPDLKIIKLECPQFTNNKSNFVKYTNVQCIHKNGDPVLDNWTFTNCYHSGQGTTSNEYGYSARNIDIICCMDGVNQYSSKITFDPDYKTTLVLGDGTRYENGTGKVSLSRTSVPNNWFNIKVNVASSENANNALLQKRYNDYLPYTAASKARDPQAKNDMEFFNCVVFVKETGNSNGTPVSRREFTDGDWHFYAIGNIGDSKKTDATRANNPDDMKEFCIEISDNTLPNAAFQTGVYTNDDGATFNYTGDGRMVFPVTEAQWNNANNVKRINLQYAFDGDGTIDYPASFEFRYDMGGETRDGDTTGLSSAERTAQRERNKQLFRDFYKWVVTSSDAQFITQLNGWCIQESMLYWYLFTERYTMIDNRAKNSFWHFGDTGVYRPVPVPKSDYMDYYYEYNSETDTYTPTSDTAVDGGKTYYWRYAFEMWDYDNDTALGINNSGELTMTYGKEDIDYRTEGEPSSGYIFNAAESVIWRRIRNLMDSQLRTLYQTLDSSNCWSSESLITEFDNWQNQFPEELWRLDIERKYYRTYRGEGLNAGATPSPTPRYLQEMMNGRKRYQRRQFERDQAAYMGTKYLSSSIMADKIEFRCNTPAEAVVTPNYDLTIVPYSDMYLSVKFGNTTPVQIRAKAGQSYTVECPIVGNMDDTMFVIYCASRIQALNDVSACYIHDNDFSSASKLQTLVIGNTTEGYENLFLTTLNLGANPLLESLDIRNCPNLTGSLNLSSCINLITLRAEGTALTAVTFANYGKIATAYLPDTINSLTLRNLSHLTTLDVSLDNLESLTEEDSVVNEYNMVIDATDTLQTLRLVGINWVLADTTLLNQILAMNSSYLSGSVFISGEIRNQELISYANAWHDLSVTYDPQNLVPQHLVRYVNADNENTLLYSVYVDQGLTPPDPYDLGIIPKPTLQSTDQYTFEFDEWDNLTDPVVAERTVVATYTSSIRTYTVTWYAREGVSLGSTTAQYGSEVVFNGNTPTRDPEFNNTMFYVFAGWDKSTGFIRGDTNVYAVWERGERPVDGTDLKDMTVGEIYAVAATDTASSYFSAKDYYDIQLGHDFNFSNVESEVLVTNTYYDGATASNTGIQLFGENETSFTIAMDVQFLGTETNNTLVACFEEDGSEGFRLRHNGGTPNVQWGDQNVAVGGSTYRDIIVLRHRKGERKLYVYASNGSSSAFASAITRAEITRSRDTSTEATLTLGGIRFLGDNGYDDYGTGMIYWCKIWYDDLGDANAQKLAAWCHEPLRIEYYGANKYRLAGNTSQRVSASFIANNLLAGRGRQMNSSDTNAGGWASAAMRPFCDTRLKAALPTVWQSMLKSAKISATAGNQSTEIVVSEDYVYLASTTEVGGSTSSPYNSEGQPMGWYTSNVLRAKFRGRIIPDDAGHYTSTSDPRTISTNNVKYGDVWQPGGGTNTNYILVSKQEIERFGLTPKEAATDEGGWISAYSWWLRSPYVGNTTNFWSVYNYGLVSTNGASSTSGVCPCFSI